MNTNIKNENMKNKKAEEGSQTEAPQSHLNPSEFGYRPGQKAPFEGNLVLSALGILNAIVMKERSITYTFEDSFDATVKTGKAQISDLGLQAMRTVELLTDGHVDNADEGFAVHQSNLMKEQAASPDFGVSSPDAPGENIPNSQELAKELTGALREATPEEMAKMAETVKQK